MNPIPYDRSRVPEADQVGTARLLLRATAAEWVKARSLTSTWSALGATLFILPAVGAAVCAGVPGGDVTGPDFEPLLQVFGGVAMSQVALGALGALMLTSEYSSRSILSTLAAVPRRGVPLAAKALLLVVLVAPTALAGSVLAAGVGVPVLRAKGLPLALTDAHVVRAVLGTAVVLTVTAMFGLAIGALLRSSTGAVIVLTVVLFLVPVVIELVPALADAVGAWTPGQAGAAVLAFGNGDAYLPPWAGLLLACAYPAVALAAAAVALRRRDA